MKIVHVIALTGLVWTAFSAPVLADGSQRSTAQASYAEEVRAALNEINLGNFAEAREHFRRAHAIDANARTLRGLGMVEFELRNYIESVRLLEEALASKVKALEGKLREETEELLRRAREYVGTVDVQVEPSAATLMVDGLVVPPEQAKMLTLPVGDHVFEFHAEGRLSVRQTVVVKGGERGSLRVVLVPAPNSVEAASEPRADSSAPNDTQKPTPLVRKWWLWTTVGLVVAAGAATAIVLATRPQHETTEPTRTSNTPPNSTIQTLRFGAY